MELEARKLLNADIEIYEVCLIIAGFVVEILSVINNNYCTGCESRCKNDHHHHGRMITMQKKPQWKFCVSRKIPVIAHYESIMNLRL